MKRITILISLTLALTVSAFAGSITGFTTGNLVVLRVGDGSAALSNASTAIFLDEYNLSGTLVQSVAIPTSGENVLTNAGTATSEGMITLSPNGYYLALAGYNIAPGTAAIASSTSSTTNRKILKVDNARNFTSLLSSTAYSRNNIRGVVTNGSDYWASGYGSTAGTNGVQYFGTGTAGQVSSTSTNIRAINIFNNQLYYSSAASTGYGIFQVGTGLPSATSQTSTLMINTGSSTGCYGFVINPTSDICYVADDRSSDLGGIQKWTSSAGIWSLAYTLATGSDIGARGITVDWSGANPVIFATTTTTTTGSKIVKIIDTGIGSVYSDLATAATNTAFRGIAFAPSQNPSTKLSSTKSNTWFISNNTLSFNELPTSNIEVYTLTGSKAAVYEPAQSIDLNLSKGVYILKVNNQTSKIMLK